MAETTMARAAGGLPEAGAASGMHALARELRALRERREELERQIKALSGEIADVQRHLVEAMVEEEVQRFHMGGATFYLAPREFVSIRPEARERVEAWLREHRPELLCETINQPAFVEWVREHRQDEQPLPDGLDACLNVHTQVTVAMRRASAGSPAGAAAAF